MLSLLSAGSNARGQLATGNADDAHQFTPCVFAGHASGSLPDHITTVEQIACGSNHTLALLRRIDGRTELWGCGDGSRGQLGLVDTAETEKSGGNASAVFRSLDLTQGDIGGYGYTVRLIVAGWETSYLVLSCPERSDVLLSMGANDYGNLAVGRNLVASNQIHVVEMREHLPAQDISSETVITILSLSAGPHHTVAHVHLAHPDGTSQTHLLGWGTSRHGQLGSLLDCFNHPLPFTPVPHPIPVTSPDEISSIALGNQHTVYLRTSGHVSGLGSNRKDQLSGLHSLSEIKRVGCTWNGTYALLCSGGVIATGSNTHSQLGRGASTQERQGTLAPLTVRFPFDLHPGQVTSLVCGSEHVLCILDVVAVGVHEEETWGARAQREVWGWGWNEHGNLGTDGTEDVHAPLRIWPPVRSSDGSGEDGRYGTVVNVWAGCGTSWILVDR